MDNNQSTASDSAAPDTQESNRSAESGSAPVGNDDRNDVELPEKISEGRPSAAASERALVRKPKIGDTMPVPSAPPPGRAASAPADDEKSSAGGGGGKRRRRGGRGRGGSKSSESGEGRDQQQSQQKTKGGGDAKSKSPGSKRNRRGRGKGRDRQPAADDAFLEQRKGRERNGKPVGRYFMCVQVRPGMAQVAVLEGRNLIEHYVSRPADDVSQIHGNIYMGKVQNVLPGMEAAFVDIATPKNAVLYRSDVQYDPGDIEVKGKNPRIEDILKNKQMILCQVTKNPIAHKGARLTQEVSLPGRFVVLIPNSKTYGISKRLPDDVRKRLRNILDRVKPDEHGLIVRTAAEHATEDELVGDMTLLLKQWEEIERKAAKVQRPTLLSREPELAVRVIREEFSADYRGVMIDDKRLYEELRDYVTAFNPELADRIEYYDAEDEGLSLFERFHVHEQVHKALDRKVWLPSGGSLIIEHTEALTVIDVNTGKNVGKSNLEETVFHNNMEAAEEVAKQLRLRDIGGIIVIDFIDMEIKDNRAKVVGVLRDALARDKTRSQVFDIGELGLVEMTRKRIGEGLLTEYSQICPDCDGRGVQVDFSMLE
ncbi:Rne/Rng family ribonuclease [Ilumatobacter nonamiensis]|uniref:Rne/Rng family ribonuclease n=1 Tax=Ilumatobacter nonamiensis TaxID=467093 RepID=UPI000349DA2C|nr:Rne/Rng family ribonuclease [Ilumatobacter nonamiensis]